MQNDKNAKRYEKHGNIQGHTPVSVPLTMVGNHNVVISNGNNNMVVNERPLLSHHHATFWPSYNVDTGEQMSARPNIKDNHFNDQTKYVNISAEEALKKAQATIDALQKKVVKLEEQQSNNEQARWRCTIL